MPFKRLDASVKPYRDGFINDFILAPRHIGDETDTCYLQEKPVKGALLAAIGAFANVMDRLFKKRELKSYERVFDDLADKGAWFKDTTKQHKKAYSKVLAMNFIADFCREKQYLFDDYADPQVAEAFKATPFGAVLAVYGCFVSDRIAEEDRAKYSELFAAQKEGKDITNTEPAAQADAATTTDTTTHDVEPVSEPDSEPTITVNTTSTPVPTFSATPTAGGTYKSSGPQSKNSVGILDPNKIILTNDVYFIMADKLGKNTPRAFVTPVNAPSYKLKAKESNGELIVNYGSGNGYTDCCCFFEDEASAKAFLATCQTTAQQSAGSTFNKYTNWHVAKTKADKNGYFKVSTVYGQCYIKASVLNETLAEATEEVKSELDYPITDVDTFHELLMNCN